MAISSYRRHCWLRFRRHAWRDVLARFSHLGPSSSSPPFVLQRCDGCGRSRVIHLDDDRWVL
jgi:hypothetical protein